LVALVGGTLTVGMCIGVTYQPSLSCCLYASLISITELRAKLHCQCWRRRNVNQSIRL